MLTTGNQLKAARALAGIKQGDLAKAARINVATISAMEGKGAAVLTSGGHSARLRPRCRVVQGSCRDRFALEGLSADAAGAWQGAASLPAKSNCAHRGLAGATLAGHFARAAPVLVYFGRGGPVHFARAAPALGHFSRLLLGHFARAGPLHAYFAQAGPAFARAGPVSVHLPRQPKPGIP